MLARRLAQRLLSLEWPVIVLELFVVMIGLIAAFQIDRWWEARGDQVEMRAYIERLLADLEEDVPALEYSINLAEVRRDFGEFLGDVAGDASLAVERPAYFLAAVSQAAYTYTPSLVSPTFDDLRATGNLRLIQDADIRRALRDYYGYDETQRQFTDLNFAIEMRYFELSAGILTFEQFRFVQDRWYIVNAGNLGEVDAARPDEAGVRAAAQRLRADEELLAWLPKTRGLQIDQIMANQARLGNARVLLNTLREYADEIDE